MASKAKENPFPLFRDRLAEGTLPAAIVLCGREQYLADRCLAMLEEAYINPATRALDLAEPDPGELTAASLKNCCETLPFLSQKRLIIIRDHPALTGRSSRAPEEALLSYLKELPETACLVFYVAGPIKKTDSEKKILPLYGALRSLKGVFEFGALEKIPARDLLQQVAAEQGKSLSRPCADRLLEISGYCAEESSLTFYHLESEIKKLAAFTGDREITPADVDAVAVPTLENQVFHLTTEICRKNRSAALRMLHDLLKGGEPFQKLYGLICSQFDLMYRIKEYQAEGLSGQEAIAKLGINPWYGKGLQQNAGNFTLPELRDQLLKCLRIDRNIKNGSLSGPLGLELFIAGI